MKTRHFIFISMIGSMLFSLLHMACKTAVIEPDVKSPRDYVWTVQEIAFQNTSSPYQVLATDVWGISSGDVYATFHSGSVRNSKLFHFNGTQWSEVDVSQFGSSQVGFDLYAVAGFSTTNIWIAGERWYGNPNPPPNFLDSTLIIHFDGSTWTEIPVAMKHGGLRAIGGSSSTDVWFGGRGPSMYHYDGVTITVDTLGAIFPNFNNPGLTCNVIAGRASSNMYAVFNDGSTGYFHFLRNSGVGWKELDSQFAWQTSLWVSPSNKIFSTFFSYGLYTWSGAAPWISFYVQGNASRCVFGSSDNNLFVTGQQGGLYQYNGIDWFKFKNLENSGINFSAVWTDGREAFVIGDDGSKSYIYHGK